MFDLTWREIATVLGTLFGLFVLWLAKQFWDHFTAKADRAELVELMEEQKGRDQEARRTRALLFAKIDECNKAISKTAVDVGRIKGRLGINDGNGE